MEPCGRRKKMHLLSRRAMLSGGAALVVHALAGDSRAWAKKTDSITPLLRKFAVPGTCVVRIEDGEPQSTAALGVRSLRDAAPMTDDTVFEAASLSKPMFACAVMRLRDRGILDLDAPLTQYVDEPFIADEPRLQMITARMILSHQSGLPHGRGEDEPLKLQSDPGTRFVYSATGFDYLQKAVNQLTNSTLPEVMQAEVLGPLGMTASDFGWRDAFAAIRAEGYDSHGKPGITFNEKYRTASAEWRKTVRNLYPELSYPSAAAGLYTTAGDYAQFVATMLNPGRNPAWLPASTIREMLQPQIAAGEGVAWGLGWGLMDSDRGPMFWHWGNWSGLFHHFVAGIPEQKCGMVVLTNSGNGLKLCQELVSAQMDLRLTPIRGFLR